MALLLRTGPSRAERAQDRLQASAAGAASLSAVAARFLTPLRLAQGRTAAGAAMLVQPRALPQVMGSGPETARRTAWSVQMLGAREVALGAGTWLALRRGARDGDPRPARLWLAAGLLSDAVDALATARAVGNGTVRPAPGSALVVVATTAVGLQVAALADDDRLLGG